MTDMGMSEEDRRELSRLQRRVDVLAASLKQARAARNAFMHDRYNSYRADVHELLEVTGLRARDMVHNIVRGPRTGSRRAVSNTPAMQQHREEEK